MANEKIHQVHRLASLELAVPPTAGSLNNRRKELKLLVLDIKPNLVAVIEIW